MNLGHCTFAGNRFCSTTIGVCAARIAKDSGATGGRKGDTVIHATGVALAAMNRSQGAGAGDRFGTTVATGFGAARNAIHSSATGGREGGTIAAAAGVALAAVNRGHGAGPGIRFVDTATTGFCAARVAIDKSDTGGRGSGTIAEAPGAALALMNRGQGAGGGSHVGRPM